MRALCGSIITAGALVGLGLTAVGFGLRFQGVPVEHLNDRTGLPMGATSLMFALVATIAGVLIGLGIAFVGLAYHHERRYRERLHHDSLSTAGRTA